MTLPFVACDTNDDGFYNEVYVDIPNLVTVQSMPITSGQHLYVSATFSRFLVEPGHSSPLDIYETTGGAPGFSFTYVLEKKQGPEWQPVQVSPNMLDVQDGSLEANPFFLIAHSEYRAETEMYRYNIGIQLETPGEYRLHFNADADPKRQAELRSESVGNNLKLNISSTVEQLDVNGFYSFTVN